LLRDCVVVSFEVRQAPRKINVKQINRLKHFIATIFVNELRAVKLPPTVAGQKKKGDSKIVSLTKELKDE